MGAASSLPKSDDDDLERTEVFPETTEKIGRYRPRISGRKRRLKGFSHYQIGKYMLSKQIAFGWCENCAITRDHMNINLGPCGVVRLGTNCETGEKVVVKSIITKPKQKLKNSSYDHHQIHHDILFLKHPNISKVIAVVQCDQVVHLVMEACTGDNLISRTYQPEQYTEDYVAKLAYKIINAIQYCHGLGIYHYKLKPEDFMFHSQDDNAELKLINFGLSKFYSKVDDISTAISNATCSYYTAPDCITENYGGRCDLWSVGAILYFLLSGFPPFYGLHGRALAKAISLGQYNLHGKEWINISEGAKDLISKLMCTQTKNCFSAKQALDHPWLNGGANHFLSGSSIQSIDLLGSLKKFGNLYSLKQKVYRLISKQFSEQELDHLTKIFRLLDRNGDGFVTIDEFRKSVQMTHKDVYFIFESMDLDGNGVIDCNEFITSVLTAKQFCELLDLS